MNKLLITLLIFTAFTLKSNAQDSILTTNPIQQKFQELIESSNNYQEYKVVNYDELVDLRDKTNDYIQELKDQITVGKNTADQQEEEIANLEGELKTTQQNLQQVTEEKDNIVFLGMPLTKGTYMAMMWGIVAILILALVFFIYKFKNSNAVTKEAKKRLDDTEKEFDTYKKKALEKEQRLGRLLQDEKNKVNKMNT
ncbi:hypothetical protein [Zunongwangia profunda]|jgi:uncharacterized coiled-coil DUF342 family protein|uniref:Secreted protein n=2 Tax=Zunongwangia profunda TaxID=398743 RepID=D5BKK4_ZUNPS|nr:hypothetical protein [Zunongwangia profunda]ADF53916.1 secreted protein [Zunongwangia profunda SM-A87]MAC66243.1 hypothetical protein [Flavobacteriaceae bacterium]MCC4230681.1 hypothetical protein [Zunongwangia profunda]HCV81622.1 hypothetical protein [Zunongwangia profunda]|tara:strand:- start:2594 stop:3184 length:591 start_codon:yes stop_codon:yes gene_type:complete